MTHFMIFQINTSRDKNRIAFEPYDRLEQYQRSAEPDLTLYDKVYDTDMEVTDLDDIFRIYVPTLHVGRSNQEVIAFPSH